MQERRQLNSLPLRGITKHYIVAVAALGIAISSVLCAKGEYSAAAVVSTATVAIGVVIPAREPGQADRLGLFEVVLLTWFVSAPVASFYIRFPIDRSILTFERIVFAALVAMLLRSRHSRRKAEHAKVSTPSSPNSATRFEIAWALFTMVALISVAVKSNNMTFATRTVCDSFALPLVAFYFARRYFDPQRCARGLILASMALALFLFATGVFELASGVNLFPFKGSEIVRAGERRVNGPFSTDSSYAIVSLLLAVFLRAAPTALRVKLDAGARFVYAFALLAAVTASLLPLFRGVAIAVMVSWLVYEAAAAGLFSRRALDENEQRLGPTPSRFRQLAAKAAVGVAILITLITAANLTSRSFLSGGRLADPDNLYSRVATWETALRMAKDHPFFGVGLWNFADYFEKHYSDEWSTLETVLDTRIVTGPHSNPLWVASELGLAGFVPYLIANISIFLIGYRGLVRADVSARATSACFLALLAAYWIPGLALVSGAYSDLNLYFFFLLGLLSAKIANPASDD